MKKLASICLASFMAATAAHAAPEASYVGRRVMVRDYQPYSVETAKGWYMGGRIALNMLNWTNEYDYGGDPLAEAPTSKDEFSFETLFGGSVFAGTDFMMFDKWWRGEIEGGLIGQFEDKGQGFEFKMTVPYIIANGYYDFEGGWYAGAGLGIALPKTELDNAYFISGDRSERGISPMFALMGGWSYDLDARLTLDLRYRLATFMGTEHKRVFDNPSVAGDEYMFTNDIGWIWENSLSMGLRYRF